MLAFGFQVESKAADRKSEAIIDVNTSSLKTEVKIVSLGGKA